MVQTFDYTAYDRVETLFVAAKIYDVSGVSPVLADTLGLAHIVNGTYFLNYTTNDVKNYVVNLAVYTAGDFATINENYTPGSVTIPPYQIAAIKAKTDNLPTTPASQGDVTTVGTAVAAVSTKLGTPAGASVSVDIAAVKTDTAAIKTKTDNLPVDPADESVLAGLISAIPTNPLLTTDTRLNHLDADISTRLATAGYTAPDNVSIAAIKAKTDNLPSDPADESLIIAATDAIVARLGTPAGASVSVDIAALQVTANGIKTKTDNLPASPAAVSDIPTAGANADAVWDEAIAGHLTAGSTGALLDAAGTAGDPWATALPGTYGVGTAGKIVGDNVDAKISTRLATTGYTAPDNADIVAIKAKTDNLPASPAATSDVTTVGTAVSALSTKVGTPASASVSADIAAVKVDTAAVKAKTDNLPASPAATSDVTTVGTAVSALSTKIGTPAGASVSVDIAAVKIDTAGIKTKTDNLPVDPASNTQVNTRLAASAYTAPDNADIVAIKAKTDNLPASPAAVSDIPTTPQIADAVWDEATSGHTTTGTTGKKLIDLQTNNVQSDDSRLNNLDATISSRLATVGYTAPLNASITAIKAKTDNLPASPAATSDIPSAAVIADAVWDEATSGHTTTGTTGKKLIDIPTNPLLAPGYTAPDNASIAAIKTKTDNLPVDPADESDIIAATTAILSVVNTRLPTSSYTAPDNVSIAAIKAKTDNLPAAPAAVSNIPTAAVVAGAVWNESLSTHQTPGSSGRVLSDLTSGGGGGGTTQWTPKGTVVINPSLDILTAMVWIEKDGLLFTAAEAAIVHVYNSDGDLILTLNDAVADSDQGVFTFTHANASHTLIANNAYICIISLTVVAEVFTGTVPIAVF